MSRIRVIAAIVTGVCVLLIVQYVLLRDEEGSGTVTGGATTIAVRNRPSLPLEYGIGEVDPRFGISRERFLELAEEARKIWDGAAGREVILHSEDAAFKVSLVFDWRQEKLIAAREARSKLDENGRSFDQLEDEYRHKSTLLETSQATFRRAAERLDARLAEYNARVERWNKGLERTEQEQRSLGFFRTELEGERAEVEKQRLAVNKEAEEVNKLGENLKERARAFNLEVDNFNGTFIRTRDFEKGVFDGSSINIYEFEKEEDLKVALIHEFGHALGLEHTESPTSIMHRKLALQDLNNIRLSEEDVGKLRERLKD